MWFAFKLCSLYIWLQPAYNFLLRKNGCDLLSNFALCTFDYNCGSCGKQVWRVVICFQTLLFVHLITTDHDILKQLLRLWFAFKLCSLYIWLQPALTTTQRDASCDLLSNFALCTFDYNVQYFTISLICVVICFQTLLFVHLITTVKAWSRCFTRLWFAFKLCSLYIWLQQSAYLAPFCKRCDLHISFAPCTFSE